jgi:hypothetical protein
MELIHIVRTRHVQSINNVHRLNMGVKTKNLRIVKEQTSRSGYVYKTLGAGCQVLEVGGANRDRTDDLLLAKQALSQLSYGPAPRRLQTLVGLAGVAPATSPLSGVRSN